MLRQFTRAIIFLDLQTQGKPMFSRSRQCFKTLPRLENRISVMSQDKTGLSNPDISPALFADWAVYL